MDKQHEFVLVYDKYAKATGVTDPVRFLLHSQHDDFDISSPQVTVDKDSYSMDLRVLRAGLADDRVGTRPLPVLHQQPSAPEHSRRPAGPHVATVGYLLRRHGRIAGPVLFHRLRSHRRDHRRRDLAHGHLRRGRAVPRLHGRRNGHEHSVQIPRPRAGAERYRHGCHH